MTTITIKKSKNLTKTEFDTVEELKDFLIEMDEDGISEDEIDFRPLREDEITPELLRLAEEARKIPFERLNDL